MEVDLRGLDPLVAEPEGDHGGVDAGVQEPHRRGVPERVWRHALVPQSWAASGRDGDVLGEPVVEPVAAEAVAAGGREHGMVGVAGAFGEPDLEDRGRGRRQGRDPVLSAFAARI